MSLSSKEIEEHGKIVQYNNYTGEFRDIFTTKEFKPFPKGSFDLLKIARYCNCKCQWELTFEGMGQGNRHSDMVLNKQIQDVDRKDMFYYLLGNFCQHSKKGDNGMGMMWKLENFYKSGTYGTKDIPGAYNFEKGSEFDLLLENLVTKSPCFRRHMAYNSNGWTLLRVLELCFALRVTDINYSDMILRCLSTGMENTPRFSFIVAQLKTWPHYRINCLLDHTLIPCTIADRILFVDQATNRQCWSFLENLLGPRFTCVKMSWKNKRLFLVAKYKPSRDCPLSTVPMDILKHILYFAEIVSLPRAVSFELTKEEEDKIKANKPLKWSEKFKKVFK